MHYTIVFNVIHFSFWTIVLKVLSHEQHEAAERNEYNFDHADAFDWELACQTLKKLKEGKNAKVQKFIYYILTEADNNNILLLLFII